MKQKNKMLSHQDVKTLFETKLTQLTSLATRKPRRDYIQE